MAAVVEVQLQPPGDNERSRERKQHPPRAGGPIRAGGETGEDAGDGEHAGEHRHSERELTARRQFQYWLCQLDPCQLEPCQFEPCQLEPCQFEPCQFEPCQFEPCQFEPRRSAVLGVPFGKSSGWKLPPLATPGSAVTAVCRWVTPVPASNSPAPAMDLPDVISAN